MFDKSQLTRRKLLQQCIQHEYGEFVGWSNSNQQLLSCIRPLRLKILQGTNWSTRGLKWIKTLIPQSFRSKRSGTIMTGTCGRELELKIIDLPTRWTEPGLIYLDKYSNTESNLSQCHFLCREIDNEQKKLLIERLKHLEDQDLEVDQRVKVL